MRGRVCIAAGLVLLVAPVAPAQESVVRCVKNSTLAGIPWGIASLPTGMARINVQASVAYLGLTTVQCTVNTQVDARNKRGAQLLKRQVAEFKARSKLFAYEQHVARGDTPGTETEIGSGVLAFHNFNPADMTQAWFAKLAAATRSTRALVGVDSALRMRSTRQLFNHSSATYGTRIYQALVEGADAATESALAAEEQARDASGFATAVEQRFRAEQPGAGRALQYSALLEHRRAMDANFQLRAAIADLRGAMDDLASMASQSSVNRLTGTRSVSW